MRRRFPTWLGLGALACAMLLAAAIAVGVYLNLASGTLGPEVHDATAALTMSPADQAALARDNPGFLYGRVTTADGSTYEGRLRWGGTQEAFWTDDFNGVKIRNPWAALVPAAVLPRTRGGFNLFGFVVGGRRIDLGRPFMARFGDLARIDVQGYDVRVTLKSGSTFDLDYMNANDIDDGVRVWTAGGQVVDLRARQIRTIVLMPTARLTSAPERLHGTVHTRQGDFSGFVEWNRQDCVGSDTLDGRDGRDKIALRFDTVRSIVRDSNDSVSVTLDDGKQLVLSGGPEVGHDNRGVYVDDPRYGRVLVTWPAFERIDFTRGDSGPGYGDFPPGRPLSGSVTTRDGRRLTGRLVYDLDESETTDTLDAPSDGVDYAIPFGVVTSIALPDAADGAGARATVTLQSHETLRLQLSGDLGPTNGGVLIFAGGTTPAYVRWADVTRVDLAVSPRGHS